MIQNLCKIRSYLNCFDRASLKIPTIITSPLPERSIFFIAFNGSAYCENTANANHGLHHLLEHLVFRDWKRVESIATRTGTKLNALTDDDRVYFHVTGLNRGVFEVVNSLRLDRKFFTLPSKSDFELERRVVLQEYDSMLTHRTSALINAIQRKFFNYYGPFGKRETIEAVTYDEIAALQHWFETPSIVVAVTTSPRFDVSAYETSGNIVSMRTPKLCVDSTYVPDDVDGCRGETIICDFVFCCGTLSEVDQFMLKSLWNDGYDSPVNTVIREDNGLAYDVRMFWDQTCGSLFLHTTTARGRVQKVRKLLDEMLRNYEKHITKTRFANVMHKLGINQELLASNKCSLQYVTHITSPVELRLNAIQSYTYEAAMAACERLKSLRVYRCSLGDKLNLGGK